MEEAADGGGLRRKNIVEYEEEGGLRRRIDVEE